jgi:hypothetical protein
LVFEGNGIVTPWNGTYSDFRAEKRLEEKEKKKAERPILTETKIESKPVPPNSKLSYIETK